MRLLYIGPFYGINIDAISSIDYTMKPYIKIVVNGYKVYELQYLDSNYDEYCNKLIEKIVDETVKIVDMRDIKKEVEHL